MAATTWIQRDLQQAGVPFEELHHDDVYTAQALAEREHVSGHRVAKVVVVIADGRLVELVLPASRRVDLELVRELLNVENARLASEWELVQYFEECEVGAIPALRHWRGVEIIMDATLRVDGDIVFNAGTHRDAVRIPFDEWFELVNPRVEFFTEAERAAPSEEPVDGWYGDNGEWI